MEYYSNYDYAGEEAPEEYSLTPTIADQSCAPHADISVPYFEGESFSQCVTLDRCPLVVENGSFVPCGFDEEASLMMVCCPEARVTDTKSLEIKPRFPQANGQPRPVEDKTQFCERWKNHGACRLDQHFRLGEDPLGILSPDMFAFMMSACMETCGWGKKVKTIIRDKGQCVQSFTKSILGMCR